MGSVNKIDISEWAPLSSSTSKVDMAEWAPAQDEPSLWDKATSNSVPGGGGFDPLGWVARLGGMANKSIQDKAGQMAEDVGMGQSARGESPSMLNQIVDVAPAATLATASEAFAPQNRLSAGLSILGPTAKVIKGGVRAASKVPSMLSKFVGRADSASEAIPAIKSTFSKPGTAAELIQGRAGRAISLGEAQYAIDHPEVLSKGQSVKEAGAVYENATPGLKGKVQSLAQRLNKTGIGPGDYENAINRAGRLLNGTPIESDGASILSPQDALEGVQTINKAMRDKRFTMALPEDQVKEYMKLKDGLMGFLQENGAPEIKAAAKNLFEAHVRDAFSGWLPKNKFGSTDAVRTMTGMGQLGTAGALATTGVPGMIAATPIAANAMLSSPRVLGELIKTSGAIPSIASKSAVAGQAVSNKMGGESEPLPKSVKELLKRLRGNR